MKTLVIIVGLLMACLPADAQVTDRFSDGNFTADPEWTGTTALFTVNTTQQLQLNSTAAGTAYLATAFAATALENTEWEFWVRLNFMPSANNFARIYLVSDRANLTQNLNGYYLQLGENASQDAVELFRQTGSARVSVCRARNGGIANPFAIRIKVQRLAGGVWNLLIDYAGGTAFVLEASGQDAVHQVSAFAGWVCTYTVSNSTRFFLDDVLITPPARDTRAPEITTVDVVSARSVRLQFDEPLDAGSAAERSNYALEAPLGLPATTTVDGAAVTLVWDTDFTNGATYQLRVQGVKDVAGNALPATTRAFLYFVEVPAQRFNIRVSEIMADPAPVVQLPEAEYVELFNRSSHPFQLLNWRLSDATGTARLPAYLLQPGQYVVLTSTANAAKFVNTPVLGVSGFPSLNNAGDVVQLQTPTAQVIDSVSYTAGWYRSTEKQDGGWALELIDPDNVCAAETNWVASEAAAGGTPGARNAVHANKPDVTGPKLVGVVASAQQVLLQFDEKLETPALPQLVFDPAVTVREVGFTDRALRQLRVTVEPFATRQRYTLRVLALRDCSGNEIQREHNSATFALPEAAVPGDVVLNEILFNPKPNGVDFVEVYNASPKFLNLKDWALANREGGKTTNMELISASDFILEPQAFLVFTENPALLKSFYPQGRDAVFFQMDVPPLNDDAGSIALLAPGQLLDTLAYDDRWHDAILTDTEGVSLERIQWQAPTQSAANWKSAPAAAGYATPGWVNAHVRLATAADESVRVDPEIISPGHSPGFSQIRYAFDQSGFIANVKILDQQGRLIKTLAHNETLGFEGFLRWDGDDDQSARVRSGYYVVWFEVFDLDGRLNTFRKRVVVANR